ncbi:hypothetical protein ACWC9T_03665 [Kitasatospora sp. NPDC001159]
MIDSSTVAGQVLPGGTLDVAGQADRPSPDRHTDFTADGGPAALPRGGGPAGCVTAHPAGHIRGPGDRH